MIEENKTANFEWSNNETAVVQLKQEDEECIYIGAFKEDPGSSVLVTGCKEEDKSLQIHSLLYGDTFATSINGSVELLHGTRHLFMNDTLENNEFIELFKKEQRVKRFKREYVENEDFLRHIPTDSNFNKNTNFPKILTVPIHVYLSPSWRSKFVGSGGGKSKAKQILSHVKLWFKHRSLDTKFDIQYQDSNIFSTSADLIPTKDNLVQQLQHFVSPPSSGHAALVYLTATTGGALGIAYTNAICDDNRKKSRSISRYHVSDIKTAQIVAHEIGHNFGFYHDFDASTPTGRTKACGPGQWNNGPNNDLMNYAPNSELTQNKWSDCSNEDFRNYFYLVKYLKGSFCLPVHEGFWTPGKNVDCWAGCGQKGGFCPSVCGEDGWCCRKGFTGDNCPDQARSVSTARHHSCVIIDSDIKNDYYLIQSSGGAAQQQASKMGRYTYTGETVRGYPVFENNGQYLFVASDGYWTVGPDTSFKEGWLYHPDRQPTPSSPPLHGWKYANNGWHDDSTLTVTHINGDKTQPGSGCFPGVSQVMLEGGEKKSMEDLRVSDVIVSMDSGKLVSTIVLGFLDKRINQTTQYLNLNIEDGRSLFISPTHAIFIKGDDNSIKSVLAKEVNPGDMVVTEKGFSQVKHVTVVVKSGAYVPLTEAGTLIVDGVLVSCYTNAPHWLAHIVLAPLRWWPTLLLDTEESQHSEGVKAYPWMVKNLGNFLGLADVSASNDKIESGDFPKREMSSPRLTPNKMDKYEL